MEYNHVNNNIGFFGRADQIVFDDAVPLTAFDLNGKAFLNKKYFTRIEQQADPFSGFFIAPKKHLVVRFLFSFATWYAPNQIDDFTLVLAQADSTLNEMYMTFNFARYIPNLTASELKISDGYLRADSLIQNVQMISPPIIVEPDFQFAFVPVNSSADAFTIVEPTFSIIIDQNTSTIPQIQNLMS